MFTRKHLGYYEVNGNIYRNKTMALQACPDGQYPHWNFNEDVFDKFDWTVEPTEDLYEIYKQRAIQLREKYDYLVLYFSGGVDSTTVLRTFVDNNIRLDAVIAYGRHIHDEAGRRSNPEIANAAIPYIQQLERQLNIKVPFHLVDDMPLFKNYRDESWVYSTNGGTLSPETYVYNFHTQVPEIQEILMKGRTALIRGVDKPRLRYDNASNRWMMQFLDKQTGGFHTSGLSDYNNTWYEVEYFFWARDMPKLLAKQAHIIKNYFEKKNDIALRNQLFADAAEGFRHTEYYKWTDPLVYSKYIPYQLPGQSRTYFSLLKSTMINAMVKDQIFLHTGEKENIDVWKSGIRFVHDSINHRFMDGKNSEGYVTLDSFIENGFTGSWSKPYYLSKSWSKS